MAPLIKHSTPFDSEKIDYQKGGPIPQEGILEAAR